MSQFEFRFNRSNKGCFQRTFSVESKWKNAYQSFLIFLRLKKPSNNREILQRQSPWREINFNENLLFFIKSCFISIVIRNSLYLLKLRKNVIAGSKSITSLTMKLVERYLQESKCVIKFKLFKSCLHYAIFSPSIEGQEFRK